jgi:hypothetical protein
MLQTSQRNRPTLTVFIPFAVAISCALVWFGAGICLAQPAVPVAISNFPLTEKLIFNRIGPGIDPGQPVVKLLPTQDKQEIAVGGLVYLQVPPEIFLQSFRESMVRKNDSAILEIGGFSSPPTINDLQNLTLEPRDIDDLKTCVAGDCKVKLSARMMQRFQNEIDWTAPDYRAQVTLLFKNILLDYVRDYLRQGDAAMIEYNDKPKGIRLAGETQSLIEASTFGQSIPSNLSPDSKRLSESGLSVVENALVWSKIKFGLKPVIAINHIVIYKQEHTTGPQVLVLSKQIYANHYFDASLAVTAFGKDPKANDESYLFYENRSRVDGLNGLFGRLKRGVIEDQAVDNLTTILEKSKASLLARMSGQPQAVPATTTGSNWKRRVSAVTQVALLVFLISAFVALLLLGKLNWKRAQPGSGISRRNSLTSHRPPVM